MPKTLDRPTRMTDRMAKVSRVRLKAFGIALREDSVLLLERAPGRNRAGEWDFPGGSIEPGEDPIEGLRREAAEETGLKFQVGRPISVQSRIDQDQQEVAIVFLLQQAGGPVLLSEEHRSFRWVLPEAAADMACAFYVKTALERLHAAKTAFLPAGPPQPARIPGRYAVVDIGSNTLHMLIAECDGVQVRALDDVSDYLRLGADLEMQGAISPEKIDEAAASLRNFVQRAQALGVAQPRLLATQAVRAAANREAVVAALERAAGVPVIVLDPDREAFYAVLGAALTRTWGDPHLVVDVGGASTQISVAASESLLGCRSVPVGSGRLATRFYHDPPSRDELHNVRNRVAEAIDRALSVVLAENITARGAVVVGGAMKRVARLINGASSPAEISQDDLSGMIAYLLSRTSGAIAQERDIEFERVPMVRAGALILSEVLRAAGLLQCTVSPYGIREGAIIDLARTAAWQPLISR